MEFTKSLISTAMARWGKAYLFIFFSLLIYIVLYISIRESSLINDELALYEYLKDVSSFDLWKVNWSNAFKFVDSNALESTPYYRPILNYIYSLGFKLYDFFGLTPLIINWSLLFYLGLVVDNYLKKYTNLTNTGLFVFIYLLLPFNFESVLFFPNLSDIIIQIIALKLLTSFSELNGFNTTKILKYIFIIIFSFLVKEAALILVMIPIASNAISNNKKMIDRKSLTYFLLFATGFVCYYILRLQFTSTTSLELDVLRYVVNYFKGIFNFFYFTQDLNLAVLIFLPITAFIINFLRNSKNYKLFIYTFLIIAPVAFLQPDDRFFHIAYFIMFISLIRYKWNSLTKLLLFSIMIVFLYKSYSTYTAHKIREQVRIEFNKNNKNHDETTIAILPYRHGNEAEIFLNGTNQYIGKQKLIPVLVKEKYLFRDFNIDIINSNSSVTIKSSSKIFVPQLNKIKKANLYNLSVSDESDSIIFWENENKVYIIYNFLTK